MNYIFSHLLNDMSGSPRVLSDLIKHFPKKGKKILITNAKGGFLCEDDVDKFITVPYVLVRNKYLKLFLYLSNQILSFITHSFLLLVIKLKREKSTVVVNTLLPFGSALAAKLFANKVIYYVHETYISPPLLNKMLTNVALKTSDEIIFVSNYVKSFHSNFEDRGNTYVVYNPLRYDFNEVTLPTKNAFNDKHILYVGTLREYKGIHEFLSLARMLPERSFVAAINADVNEFEQFLLQQKLPTNLCILRRPENLCELYSQALFTLNLSLPHLCIETFGLTLLESMHFSTPVIAPNYGGPKEIINERVGFLVEPTELHKIKDIILKTNEADWRIMSKNASDYSKMFSVENYIEEISEIISGEINAKKQ
ncbi:glycosyltransferase family 4 protein [Vibrio metschnikovii]|nr:glycosyltransferase family 4 protein [Vibrio metschnikovii]